MASFPEWTEEYVKRVSEKFLLPPLYSGLPDYRNWPLKRKETAFLIIDVQYLSAHPDWGLGKEAKKLGVDFDFSYYWDSCNKMVKNIQRVQKACREKGVEVIFVKIAGLTANARDTGHLYKIYSHPYFLCSRDSKEAQILEEIKPVGDELVLSKTSSGMGSSVYNCVQLLYANMGLRNLFMCGVVTNGCVDSSVRYASDVGFDVWVIGDACAALTQELHEFSLANMKFGYCRDVVMTDWVIEQIQNAI